MPQKYRDAVVYVTKSSDGTVSRTNALVLASVVQPANINPNRPPAGALKDRTGFLPEGEYLDLAYAVELPEGVTVRSHTVETLIRKAFTVPPWKEGAHVGWEKQDPETVAIVEANEAATPAPTNGKTKKAPWK